MTELARCPFCGGAVELVLDHTVEEIDWIRHKNAPACGVEFSRPRGQVIAAWNRRATPADVSGLVERLVAWLRRRGEPNSGIKYESASPHHGYAEVTLSGPDATFIANNFHGKGARDLADALSGSQPSPARGVEAVRVKALEAATATYSEYLDQMLAVGHPLARETVVSKIVDSYLSTLEPAPARADAGTAEGEP